jgi:tRNA(Ile)-lysidine synthase
MVFSSKLIERLKNKTCWLAFSGGLDSSVLLSLCDGLREDFNMDLRAIHVNHGISPHANSWSHHCRQICEAYGIPLVESAISLGLKPGDSLEEVARNKRYAVFAEYLQEGDVLLTAHHQDDQAETVLLQLLRGAGPKGLAAMPAIKRFAKGYHARPLLESSRDELESYAKAEGLNWIEDESNEDDSLSRNYIRREIMPRLKARWPAATASISRSASHCGEAQMLLDTFARGMDVRGSREGTLSVAKLLGVSEEQQKLLLRSWMQEMKCPLPDARRMEVILKTVLLASWDSLPVVAWGEVRLRRYRDDLYLMPGSEVGNTEVVVEWKVDEELILPGIGVLKTVRVEGRGLRLDVRDVYVGFRKGGEVLEMGRRGRHTLKNLFQEWGVLPWERGRTPLVFVGDKLIAVVGYWVHEDYLVGRGEIGREIVFIPGSGSKSPGPGY